MIYTCLDGKKESFSTCGDCGGETALDEENCLVRRPGLILPGGIQELFKEKFINTPSRWLL